MKKRLTAMIILCAMVISVLTGCTLFEHNYERDAAQIVGVLRPITLEYFRTDENGVRLLDENGQAIVDTHTSEKYSITKGQLFNMYVNNYGGQEGVDPETALFDTLEGMITRRLVIEYAYARLYEGSLIVFNRGEDNQVIFKNIEGDGDDVSITDQNIIWRNTYSTINDQIFATANQILSDRNEPERTKGEYADLSTEFPVQEDLDAPVQPERIETVRWTPDPVMYPGERDFLFQTATERFARNLIDVMQNDTTLTRAERNLAREDKALVDRIVAEANGRVALYGELANLHCVKRYIYKDHLESQLVNRLRQMITEDISISDAEIVNRFNLLQRSQAASFSNSVSAYESALDGTDPVLYYTDAQGYYYVKHILVPFSDEQTARIETFNQVNQNREDLIAANRRAEAEKITALARVDGNTTGNPISIRDIYNEVASVVNSRGNHRDKEREFDRLIYKYNTDNGIFEKPKGYLVKPEGNNFVDEFQAAADKLYQDFVSKKSDIGAISGQVVTQFGVHILYLSSVVTSTPVSLFDYETAAQYGTRSNYDIIKEILRSEAEAVRFDTFINNYVSSFLDDDDYVVKYTSRFKDLYS